VPLAIAVSHHLLKDLCAQATWCAQNLDHGRDRRLAEQDPVVHARHPQFVRLSAWLHHVFAVGILGEMEQFAKPGRSLVPKEKLLLKHLLGTTTCAESALPANSKTEVAVQTHIALSPSEFHLASAIGVITLAVTTPHANPIFAQAGRSKEAMCAKDMLTMSVL